MSLVVRAAIGLHPVAWRERYADEVLGTLQDVADSHGGKVPLGESVPLGLRGLWLRVRGSVTFWAGLLIITLQIALSFDWYYDIDGSLTSYLLTLNEGIGYSLPLLALASGWAAARARNADIPRASQRLGRLAADTWPLLAAQALGSVAALVVLVARFGMPWYSGLGSLVVLAQCAMVLAAIALGQILGSVLPRVLVIFAAPAAAVTVSMLLLGWQNPWNAMPWSFYLGIAYEVDTRPIARICLSAAVIVAVALVVVSLRTFSQRLVPILTLAATVVLGAAGGPEPTAPAPVPRAKQELVCSAVQPIVCLWPEQDAAFGADYRRKMTVAFEKAKALGLPVGNPAPRSAAQFSLTGISSVEGISGDDLSEFGLGITSLRPDEAVGLYAQAMTAGLTNEPTHGLTETLALGHSIAILLGVPADQTWPLMKDPFTGSRLLDPADAPDKAAAVALVHRWLEHGVDGVRSPS